MYYMCVCQLEGALFTWKYIVQLERAIFALPEMTTGDELINGCLLARNKQMAVAVMLVIEFWRSALNGFRNVCCLVILCSLLERKFQENFLNSYSINKPLSNQRTQSIILIRTNHIRHAIFTYGWIARTHPTRRWHMQIWSIFSSFVLYVP